MELINYAGYSVLVFVGATNENHAPSFADFTRAAMASTGAWQHQIMVDQGHDEQLPRLKLLETMGGAPVGLPFTELYSSIERRVVDAYSSATSAVIGSGLFEVTKYAEDWPAGHGLWFYVVSEDALKLLPPDTQKAVMDEFALIQRDLSQRQLAETTKSIEDLKAKGMQFIVVPEAEKQKARDLARKIVWTTWLERTGPEGRALLINVLKTQGKGL